MRQLEIENYVIDKPIIDILYDIQGQLTNGKLKDIKPQGDYIMITCPVHSGGHEVHPDSGIYVGNDYSKGFGYIHCFACDFVSDFVGVVAALFDVTKDYAKEWLIKNYGVLAREKLNIGEEINLSRNNYRKPKAKDIHILDQYQSYCPYLAKRHVSREIAEKFSVKYDPIHKQVIFPSFDEKGNLVAINKRNTEYKFFVLDKDSPKVVYGLDIVIKENISKVLITEGQFDCLTSWSYGVPAIATLGGMSVEQIDKINNSCITQIITAFDNDEAGKKFTQILKNRLSKRILVSSVTIPNGFKDVADLDKETLLKIVENAN